MAIDTSFAVQQYAATRPATAPKAQPDGDGGAIFDIGRDFAQTLVDAEQTAQAAMTGGADQHALVQALAQTELAIETAVTVRDKVVEAYQEILRMPV